MAAWRFPVELRALVNLIGDAPEAFAAGNSDFQAAALDATTYFFDLALASELASLPVVSQFLSSPISSDAPQTRSRAKAKASKDAKPSTLEPTPLTSLFVKDMDTEQIWEQLDLRGKKICDMLEVALIGTDEKGNEGDNTTESIEIDDDAKRKALEMLLKEHFGVEADQIDAFLEAEGIALNSSDSDAEGEETEENEESDGEEDLGEGIEMLRDSTSSGDEEVESSPFKSRPTPQQRSPLDDDFFDLASFNAETEADAKHPSEKSSVELDFANGEEDEEDGEDVDLYRPIDVLEKANSDTENHSGLYYKDFFDPPPRKSTKKPNPLPNPRLDSGSVNGTPATPSGPGKVRFHEEVRVRNIKAKGKGMPVAMMRAQTLGIDGDDDDSDSDGDEYTDEMAEIEEEFGEISHIGIPNAEDNEFDGSIDEEMMTGDEDDVDGFEEDHEGKETFDRLKGDLFEAPAEDKDLSSHEKRLAALQSQISAFEAENVAKKNWVLMGEASSKSRPLNSLLEEDLEFERIARAAPAISDEVVEELEERIKTRIMEGRFDDVVRIHEPPEKAFLPSKLFELKDTKSELSLAQIYEKEYMDSQGGLVPGHEKNEKLKKEHEEIEKLWEGICYKLDALCNAHFVPKQPKAIISTMTNVSTASLESALPTTKSASTLLAPEEIFASASADLRARSEYTPKEKQALRNKLKRKKKRLRDALEKSSGRVATINGRGKGRVAAEKAEALNRLKKVKGVTIDGAKKERKPKSRTRS